jgi:hypothetical protein
MPDFAGPVARSCLEVKEEEMALSLCMQGRRFRPVSAILNERRDVMLCGSSKTNLFVNSMK